jgi:uncharacterized protein (TIGR02246 family)
MISALRSVIVFPDHGNSFARLPANPWAGCPIFFPRLENDATKGQPMSANLTSNAADEAAIRGVLSAYQDALNASNTEAVMPLYTEDGVFMPPNNQSAVGKAAVRQAYDAVFKAITLNVKFHIAELVTMSPEWAFVRTNSAGTNKINASGAVGAEGNQELFIFNKGSGGKWRIARYSFSTTNPLPGG